MALRGGNIDDLADDRRASDGARTKGAQIHRFAAGKHAGQDVLMQSAHPDRSSVPDCGPLLGRRERKREVVRRINDVQKLRQTFGPLDRYSSRPRSPHQTKREGGLASASQNGFFGEIGRGPADYDGVGAYQD